MFVFVNKSLVKLSQQFFEQPLQVLALVVSKEALVI